jgi:hypothetical protein
VGGGHGFMKKKFKFGDKVHAEDIGNCIFNEYGVRDKQYPQYNANVFIYGQGEDFGIEAKELKRGWLNGYKY